MIASIITIGDEILIGQITDTNSVWLANQLNLKNISVIQMLSIADKKESITSAIENGLKSSDLIILTGGLGPTKDDITKKTLAEFVDSPMFFDQALYDKISAYFSKRKIPLSSAIKDQCWMPEKAQILENNLGTAPGMLFDLNGQLVLSMPGVPYEMKWIFENSFLPYLDKKHNFENQVYHTTIRTVGWGESRIAEDLNAITEPLPSDVNLAFLPSIGQVRLRLSSYKANDQKIEEIESIKAKIVSRLAHLVYGYDKVTLEESLMNLFVEKGLTFGTAESCTGGYIAHKLTSISGSSAYYQGSIIAYSYALKNKLLDVSENTLTNHGAVSEETVKEMLAGLLKNLDVDIGVAVSGIAGPGGGTPEKPVGTIWMAWGDSQQMKTRKLNLLKDRSLNIQYTTVAALNAVRLFLLGEE